jgi:hypothetical protein
MLTTKLAATLVVLAALTTAPSVATAAPHAPEKGISLSQPMLDWGNSFIDASQVYGSAVIDSVHVKYTMFDASKSEVAIETLESATGFWIPEVNDEVL